MNKHLRLAAVAACAFAFALPANAAEPGWYLFGELGYSHLNDADSSLELDPNFTPGTPGAPPTPGSCFLLLPGLACLFPTAGTPGGPATPPTPTPGAQFDFQAEYDDGYLGGLGLGYAWESGLRMEIEVRYATNDLDSNDVDGETESTAALANLWFDFNPDGTVHPYIGGGVGGAQIDADFGGNFGGDRIEGDDTVLAYQAGLGIEFDLTDVLALGIGYRYFGTGDPEFEVGQADVETEYNQHVGLLTLRYVFAPAARTDSDGDGVPDIRDKCPNTPAGAAVDADGCPLDTDGDGVPDYKDQCPNTPAGVAVDANGCPLDSDGDGVPDYKDNCPNTPKGTQVNASGCPLVIDTDGDGVPDDRDMCPDTPPGVPVLTNGCAVGQSTILQGVNFEFNAATLTETAREILIRVAEVLKDSPGFTVEVAGHTDSIGTSAYNLDLSQRRANSVVDFLVAQGVNRSRLNPVGYGETQPLAPNNEPDGSDNPTGRAMNRRVELRVTGTE